MSAAKERGLPAGGAGRQFRVDVGGDCQQGFDRGECGFRDCGRIGFDGFFRRRVTRA